MDIAARGQLGLVALHKGGPEHDVPRPEGPDELAIRGNLVAGLPLSVGPSPVEASDETLETW